MACRVLHGVLVTCILSLLGTADVSAEDVDPDCAAACPGERETALPCFYAQSSWPSVHRDSRNSDDAPYAVSRFNEVKWTALDGASLFGAPSIGPEGNLYATTGQGPGTSHLHAFDRDGNLLWESAPQQDVNDLDSSAAGNIALVDCNGDVYISDANQFWAFHSDGSIKWIKPLPVDSGPLISPVFSRGGLVGGVSGRGKVLFYDRDTSDLAYPILDLPGSGGPIPTDPPPDGLLAGGLVDPEIIETLFYGLFGNVYEVVNTPAIHPTTGRLYIVGGGATPEVGTLYGIDFGESTLSIAFESSIAGGSGSSPAISPNGDQVYAVGGDSVITAFDAETGVALWNADRAGLAASPTVGRDGTIYTGFLESITALNPEDGSIKWSTDLNERALEALPPIPALRPVLPGGQPLIVVNSVITTTPEYLWAAAVLSYEYTSLDLPNVLGIPRATLLLALRPDDGSIAQGVVLRDTCGGTISIGTRGDIYVSHSALISSLYYYEVNPLMPDIFDVPQPIGGLTALGPMRRRDHFHAGIQWAEVLSRETREGLEVESPEELGHRLGTARNQISALRDALSTAVEEDELAPLSATSIRWRLEESRTALGEARALLLGDGDGSDVARSIAEALEALDYAWELWPVVPVDAPDYDQDGDVDEDDVDRFASCFSGPEVDTRFNCGDRDLDGDGDADQSDFAHFQRCLGVNGTNPNPDCLTPPAP